MNENDRGNLLSSITPPAGGWSRLQSRRQFEPPERLPWLALAAGMAAAYFGSLALEQAMVEPLVLPANRLLEQKAAAESAPVVSDARIDALPSADAGVRLYWAEPAQR